MSKINRHTTFYVNEIKPVELCGKPVMWQMELNGAYEIPFEIEPTKGKHDFNKCEVCKNNLSAFTNFLEAKFKGYGDNKKAFPYCCSDHSNLVKVKEFNKASFVNVPSMVARKIVYTNQHIENNCNSENWYKIISDYIEWVVESFGQMPTDCGERLYLHYYFFHTTDLLKRNNEVPTDKKNRILEFLNSYNLPSNENKTDLNILFSIYQKWLKEFPFEINSYFGNLKQNFEKQLPILNGKPEENIYSGMAKAKMHTKESLFETLLNLTDNLLTQINGVTLYDKGLITDGNKIKLELVLNSRKLKLKQGYKNSSLKDDSRFRKMIKEWFKDEKKFIDELTPLLNTVTPQKTEGNKEKQHIEIKPVFKPEAIELIFDILKDYFKKEQQTILKTILETGNKTGEPLIFIDNGNRLTDTFKKLIEHDFITSCNKQDLINWVTLNFKFRYRNEVKEFIYGTVEKTISRNDNPCKSPLIKIEKGEIIKIEQPRKKKYTKH